MIKKQFYFKCLCHYSFKKNDPPHNPRVALNILSGKVKKGACSCVAGKVGFCNHVLALMMKICKLNLYDCKDVFELDRDDDMLPTEACTSSLQTWHRKGRGDFIHPQPDIEVNVKKPKLDDCYLNTFRPVTSSERIRGPVYSLRSSEQLEDPGKWWIESKIRS